MSLVEQVKAAGVIGAGGAGFPTYVKLEAKADYILLNGAECEPLLRVDQQLMEFYSEEVIKGLHLAGKQVQASKAIIGVKVKHKRVIQILRDTIKKMVLEDEVEVKELEDVYPAGDEQVLVYELTGRIVPEMGIPIAVGCVVINTETALNVYHASQGEPVTMKYVTVAGDIPQPITVKVPVGTPLKEVMALGGISNFTGYKVVDGGPMMGPLLKNLDGYVNKKTKGLIILREDHSLIHRKEKEMKSAINLNKTACEQCRICTDLCPRYLLGHSTSPHKMVRAMGYNIDADEEMTVAQTCCQCNLCEYFACPAGINPKMANVYYMTKLREKGIRHKPVKEEFTVREMRDYRLVPSKRLTARLELKDFDKAAPLLGGVALNPETVGIALSAHVGAGAIPKVAVGDKVKVGDEIGEIKEGNLGAPVHASINGTVAEVKDNLIVIRRD